MTYFGFDCILKIELRVLATFQRMTVLVAATSRNQLSHESAMTGRYELLRVWLYYRILDVRPLR